MNIDGNIEYQGREEALYFRQLPYHAASGEIIKVYLHVYYLYLFFWFKLHAELQHHT